MLYSIKYITNIVPLQKQKGEKYIWTKRDMQFIELCNSYSYLILQIFLFKTGIVNNHAFLSKHSKHNLSEKKSKQLIQCISFLVV